MFLIFSPQTKEIGAGSSLVHQEELILGDGGNLQLVAT